MSVKLYREYIIKVLGTMDRTKTYIESNMDKLEDINVRQALIHELLHLARTIIHLTTMLTDIQLTIATIECRTKQKEETIVKSLEKARDIGETDSSRVDEYLYKHQGELH